MKKAIVVKFADGHIVTRELSPGQKLAISVQTTAVRDTEEDFLTVKIDEEYSVIAPMGEIKYFYITPRPESFMEGIDRITDSVSDTALKDMIKNYLTKDNKVNVDKLETQFALPPEAIRKIIEEG